MQTYQKTFIELALAHNVLCFGDFTLKSGRISPYFFNAGRFKTGAAMAVLGKCYASALKASAVEVDILFGPAYKGIPLVTATGYAMSNEYGRDYPLCYNRKEAKNHGEGGVLVGAELKGKVAIIDDVITAGTAIREVMKIIDKAGAELGAVLIGLDRKEKGQGKLSAVQEIEQKFTIPVISIITLDHIIQYIEEKGDIMYKNAMYAYRDQYGI
ncbi:MAG: orotate phosphoribosyltransferase [Pseudomonadota bacterium]